VGQQQVGNHAFYRNEVVAEHGQIGKYIAAAQ
jgi:hypothetical protein